jgi:hypothetical protein
MTSEWDTDIAEELIAGDFPNGGFISVGSDIPAELKAFYNGSPYGGINVQAYIRMQNASGDYYYMLSALDGANRDIFAFGWVDHTLIPLASSVHEAGNTFYVAAATIKIQTNYGLRTPMYISVGDVNAAITDVLSQFYLSNLQFIMRFNDPRSSMSVNGNELGWGLLASQFDTANSAAIGVGFTAVLTTPAVTFKSGRAYEITFGAAALSSVAGGRVNFHANEDTAAGVQLCDFGNVAECIAAAVTYQAIGMSHFVNSTAADISAAIALCMAESGPAGTVTQVGSVTRPRWVAVKDVGVAAQYPWAVSLV